MLSVGKVCGCGAEQAQSWEGAGAGGVVRGARLGGPGLCGEGKLHMGAQGQTGMGCHL